MALRLPPLSSLRLFEAAGRLGSFKAAAAELNVTPSAVSHGIVSLERTIGAQLFSREPRGLTLTPIGQDYLSDVAEALALIANATDRIPGKQRRGEITLSCAPTVASRWLIPRLPKFSSLRAVAVSVDTSRRQVGFPVDGFDFAVRMSRSVKAPPAWSLLFGERLTPVCSRDYRATLTRNGRIDLTRATLLHVSAATEDWRDWAERTHISGLDLLGGLRFDTIQMAFDAAVTGIGVALGRRPLVDRELADGSLVELGLPTIEAQTGYWLVKSDAAAHRPDLLSFQRWLLREAQMFRETEPSVAAPPLAMAGD